MIDFYSKCYYQLFKDRQLLKLTNLAARKFAHAAIREISCVDNGVLVFKRLDLDIDWTDWSTSEKGFFSGIG